MTTTTGEREKRVAQRRVKGFTKQFGQAHRNLARHAAFPLSLTPDLLYQIWANFVPEAPWEAVAHLLLSRLCRQVGYEMYEMDIADRNLLLRELKEQFGQERLDELAEFLLDYVAQRLTDDDPDTQDLREAQEWTALAYTKPNELVRELAQRLSERVQQEDMGEVLRLASLADTFAEPLLEEGLEPLLVYSHGMVSLFRGDSEQASELFCKLQVKKHQLLIAGVNLEIPILPTEKATTLPEIQRTPLSRQEYRNRKVLLTKVNNFWVKGVLEKSLYNQVRLELGLEENPDAITNPCNVLTETDKSSPKPLPNGTKIIDIFDQIGEGRTLLILGKPGSGKTTTLLELTRDLTARAEQDSHLPIPVVFHLSSWANKRQKIEDWLVEELNTKYDVPKKIGQDWVTQQQLLPLLDGLDEVKANYRDDCIAALNQFQQNYGAELVVCSRIKDYEALSNRLNFQNAIYIRSLTLEQICHYLDSMSVDLIGLRTLIIEDSVLQELAQSPLMLNIMMLAYQGVAIEDLPRTEVIEERRKQFFDDFIMKMLNRPNRSKGDLVYSTSETIRWLSNIARFLEQENRVVFSIEHTLPAFLQYVSGNRPWNYSRFLDYATERLLLQKVGNSYRFIHRLLQKHFAELQLPEE